MRRHLLLALITYFTYSWAPSHAGAQQPVLIEGATVVSPHINEPLAGVSVLIEGGRIRSVGRTEEISVPAGALRIDGNGKWVTPGIVEVHTHTSSAAGLRRGLALGVTTAQVISRPQSPGERERRADAPETPTPRLTFLTGYVGEFMERMGSQNVSKPRTISEAESEVLRMHADGVRAVKIWQDDGTLWFPPEQAFPAIPADVMGALVRTAHRQGMRVVVHAWRLPYFAQAVDAGVDGLIHPVADTLVPSSVWERMREQGLAWTMSMTVLLTYGDIPQYARRVLLDPRLAEVLSSDARAGLVDDTLTTEFDRYSAMPTLRANRQAYIRTVQENTRNALGLGVSIVVGSDATIGIGTHIEMELMAEAGLTASDILTAATANGARALGMADRIGTIEAGKLADLIILNSDPLDDVRNLRDIDLVLKGGYVFAPRELIQGSN